MTEAPDLDVDRVIEVLDRRGVAYLLVGGVGARLHGATRPTQDIDLLPRTDAENLERLAAALRDLGAFLRVGGLSDDEARALPMVIDGLALRGLEISTWRTDAGDLDILQFLRGRHGDRREFEELEPNGTTIETAGTTVRLAGLVDIVASKVFAGRDKDLEALPELEQLLRNEQPHG